MSNSLFQDAASACQSSSSFDIISPLQPSLQLSLSPASAWSVFNRDNAALQCARPGSGSPANMSLEYDAAFKQFQLIGLVFKTRNPDKQNTLPVFMLDGLRLPLQDTTTAVLFDSSNAAVRQNATNHQLSVTNSEDFGVCIACFKFTRQDAAVLPAASSSSSSLSASPSSNPAGPAPGSASQDPATTNSTQSSTSSLSGPVKGVIIALTLAIFAALALLLFALVRRRRQRRQMLTPNVLVGGKADLDAYDGYIEMDTPVNPTPPRGTIRHFASFSQSSVSSIPQPPPSEEPPSSGRASVVRQITSATLERLRSLRRDGLRRDHELNRRPVLRVANA